jgi:D-glycero-alpha-D-manno-heptose-7-phosphate kinase
MNRFIINSTSTIKAALKKIESNEEGIICISNNSNKIIGIATDGDIRRKLLDGVTIDKKIGQCANKNFIFASKEDSRESILKLLDNGVKAIPILDKDGLFLQLVSKNNLPISKEKKNFSRSRAPVRVSFGGGGSDLTHFFSKSTGAVINATISIYTHACLRQRNDNKVIIKSRDLNTSIEEESLELALKKKSNLSLIQSLIKLISPNYGFELEIYSDFPSNSGLGGSSAVSAAVLGCFNEFRKDPWDTYELSELAFQAERLSLNIAGGWQDQYACTFGGFNFIEFKKDTNIIHPLRIQKSTKLELEESLILCDTGISHNSGNIHNDQKESMKNKNIDDLVKRNVDLTYEIKNQLLRGKLSQFGSSLDKAWEHKRKFSSNISSPKIDSIYNEAKNNGAIGGKLLGAGGGGFFLFYVAPFKRQKLVRKLELMNLKIFRFTFDDLGLQTWKTREEVVDK